MHVSIAEVTHVIVKLASVITMVRKVKDEVSRWMLLIKECSNSAEVILMERIVMRIGHGWKERERKGEK